MRRKLILGVVVFGGLIGIGYIVGATVVILGLVAFGLGFLVGKRRAAH
jgi:hypothetical protein